MNRDTGTAPRPAWTETERLAALEGYAILDTPVEAEFEDMVQLVSEICQAPIAVINFVGEGRQWFKAERGLGVQETPRDVSICAHAILQPGIFVVPDLTKDDRFTRNPLVTGAPELRFYAGALLETADKVPIGTVCVLDYEPRPSGLMRHQSFALQVVANQVMAQLDLRRAVQERDRALAEERAGAAHARLLTDATNDAVWDWDLVRDHVVWNEALHEAYGHDLREVTPDGAWWLAHIHPGDRERVSASIPGAIDTAAANWRDEYRFRKHDGSYAHVFDRATLIRDEGGIAVRMIGAMLDLTERKQAEARRNALSELGDRLRDSDDTAAMAYAAGEIMGRTLEVGRAGYGTIDPDQETITIERDWTAPGIASLAGLLHFRDFGTYIDDLKRGEAVVVADAEIDPRTAATAEALKGISARSFVNLPVTEHGQSVALFYTNHPEARPWSAEEVAFIRNVADRTRAAVERVRAASALRDSEERFGVFAQVMPNQVWAADASGRLDWVNQQVQGYFGLQASTGGASWMGVVHPDDVGLAAERWARSIATGDVYETEFRLRRHDGAYRWYLARALPIRNEARAVVRWIGTNTDVHDQKENAAELARLNGLLAGRIEERTRERDRLWSTTNDLMGTGGLDGYLKAVNPAWTRMLGWSEDELLARPFAALIDPADHSETEEIVARLSAGETVSGYVDHLIQKDGGRRTVTWNAVPDGGMFYVVGRDITAEREIEDQLRQSQKMEAVGQLTGGIAHDFNNLLTGIVGSLDLMQTRMAQGRTENLERYAKAAMSSANRAAALTHRLLAFARRQPLDPKPTDANALVTSLEDLLRRTIGEAIGLEIVTAGGLWPTLCDPNQLESAILNLAINARDAMPNGGKLTIETCNTHLDWHYAAQHPGVVSGQYICLCVTDTGVGMGPEVIGRAFDPFYTTKPIGQGTGLGLSMVYGFARQSEGHAAIYSEVGKGTTVKIYLPRHRSGKVVREEEATTGLTAAHRAEAGETVLVVEDEPVVRDLVVEVLHDLGYQALEAIDGPSGLAVLQSGARIDLLVTDVGLPGLNGRQLADQARLTRPDLRILFITGYAENAVLASGFLDPGMEMITKPFPVDALASRIRSMIEG
ncbi:PAS domain-containing protein [uncultured Enterovirga sp.]|uniref:PAS domain-containing protein n=1 Tax=uncultured Enterovirga sp. TaxID=2026352 RepID=UPI0035CBD2F7